VVGTVTYFPFDSKTRSAATVGAGEPNWMLAGLQPQAERREPGSPARRTRPQDA
jgi:hypothetical protein